MSETSPSESKRPPAAPPSSSRPPRAPESRRKSLEMERLYLKSLIGPEFRPVLGMVAITVGIGTVFYSLVEHWRPIDALYFSVVTLATIGYGDFAPHSRIAKVFIIFYVFAGVGTLGLFLSTVARASTRQAIALQRQDEVTNEDGVDDDREVR